MIEFLLMTSFSWLLYVLHDINKFLQNIKTPLNNVQQYGFVLFCLLTFLICVYIAFNSINSVSVVIFVSFLSFILTGAYSHIKDIKEDNGSNYKYIAEIKNIILIVSIMVFIFQFFIMPYFNYIGGIF